MDKNKHGLNRHILPNIKQKIRQNAGFGCVVCGLAIAQYEHIDPEFKDAKEHDPDCMTLLCGACHDKVTRGVWSKEKIKNHKLNPITFKNGCTKDTFDFGNSLPLVIFGTSLWKNTPVIISALGKNLLSFKEPESTSGPIRLSCYFADKTGKSIFEVNDNIGSYNKLVGLC